MNSRNNNANTSQNISQNNPIRVRNLFPTQIQRNGEDLHANTSRNVISSTELSSQNVESIISSGFLRMVSTGLNNNVNLQGRNLQTNRFNGIISNTTSGNNNNIQGSDVEIQVNNEEDDFIYDTDSDFEEEWPTTRRRYQNNDGSAESNDELPNTLIEDEYIDYKTYPLLINWNEIENEKSEAYAIYDKHGYFGASLFSTLSRIPKLKLTLSRFHKNILEYYYKICLNSTKEATNHMIEFIKNLPDLKIIKIILLKLMMTQKEIVSVKFILDIYEHYYINFDYFPNKRFFNEYLPAALLFYSMFSDEDIFNVYDNMTNINCNKNLSEIMSKIYLKLLLEKLGINITKKRSVILERLKELKNDVTLLYSGIDDSKFIM